MEKDTQGRWIRPVESNSKSKVAATKRKDSKISIMKDLHGRYGHISYSIISECQKDQKEEIRCQACEQENRKNSCGPSDRLNQSHQAIQIPLSGHRRL